MSPPKTARPVAVQKSKEDAKAAEPDPILSADSGLKRSAQLEQIPNNFVKSQTCALKLLKKNKPSSWSQPTLLLRMITAGGMKLSLNVTNEAIPQFEALVEDVAYEIVVPGRCVKKKLALLLTA